MLVLVLAPVLASLVKTSQPVKSAGKQVKGCKRGKIGNLLTSAMRETASPCGTSSGKGCHVLINREKV